jgi:uncharacterized protein (TIGR01777 family)
MREVHRIYRSRIAATPDMLFQWHAQPAAFERLIPPWSQVSLIDSDGTIEEGDRKRIRLTLAGPIGFTWEAVHASSPDLPGFDDRQVSGPFASWHHQHRFIPDGADGSLLEDRLAYTLPLGRVGHLAAHRTVAAELDRLFTLRHRRTRIDHQRAQRLGSTAPLRIAVTGASGLIGSRLIPLLRTQGHEVVRLTRDGSSAPDAIAWDPAKGTIDRDALEGVDAVVHLAGVSIAGGLWTERRKAAIRDSRVDGTTVLAETLAGLARPPRVLVSTSGVGYYGDTGDREVREQSPRGGGFLAEVCEAWEAAAEPARAAGIRVVHPRFGLVLAGEGGILPLLARVFRTGAGGPLGNGRQYFSWIGLDDLVWILLETITNEALEGPVNAVAPETVTNGEFSKTLAYVLHRPAVFRAPARLARLAGGQLADELILSGQRTIPARLTEVGVPFAYPTLEAALRHELGRFRPEDVPHHDA